MRYYFLIISKFRPQSFSLAKTYHGDESVASVVVVFLIYWTPAGQLWPHYSHKITATLSKFRFQSYSEKIIYVHTISRTHIDVNSLSFRKHINSQLQIYLQISWGVNFREEKIAVYFMESLSWLFCCQGWNLLVFIYWTLFLNQ